MSQILLSSRRRGWAALPVALALGAWTGHPALSQTPAPAPVATSTPATDATAQMLQALKRADADGVRKALAAGANPNATMSVGELEAAPVLQLAAYGGHGDIVKLLLDAGADVKRPGPQGTTALMAAVYNNRVSHAAATKAMERATAQMAEIEKRMPDMMAQAQQAMAQAHSGGVPRRHGGLLGGLGGFLTQGVMTFATGGLGGGLIQHLAAPAVQNLLPKLGVKGPWGGLLSAALSGNPQGVGGLGLLGQGMQLNPKGLQSLGAGGWVTLIQAATKGNPDSVQALQASAASAGVGPSDWSAFLGAAQAGRTEEVSRLLSSGKLNAMLTHGSEMMAQNLKDMEADWTKAEQEYSFAQADPQAELALVQTLIQRGADVNARTEDGFTALDMAQLGDREDMAAVLRQAGARPGEGQNVAEDRSEAE